MKIIKYKTNDLIGYEDTWEEIIEIITDKEGIEKEISKKIPKKIPKFEIKEKEYRINDKEFEYWFDVIKKNYGKYGKIDIVEIEDEKTPEELQFQEIKKINDKIDSIGKIVNTIVIDSLGGI